MLQVSTVEEGLSPEPPVSQGLGQSKGFTRRRRPPARGRGKQAAPASVSEVGPAGADPWGRRAQPGGPRAPARASSPSPLAPGRDGKRGRHHLRAVVFREQTRVFSASRPARAPSVCPDLFCFLETEQ